MEDSKTTQQHIIDDINNNTESWFGKEPNNIHLIYVKAIASLNDTAQLQIATDAVTKNLVKIYDDLYDYGYDIYTEREVYEETEYKVMQEEIDTQIFAVVHQLHDIYEVAKSNNITLHWNAVACMADRMTQDEDGNRNPNYDKCLVCGKDIKAGIHA